MASKDLSFYKKFGQKSFRTLYKLLFALLWQTYRYSTDCEQYATVTKYFSTGSILLHTETFWVPYSEQIPTGKSDFPVRTPARIRNQNLNKTNTLEQN